MTSVSCHLNLRYGQVILDSGYPVLTTVNMTIIWMSIIKLSGYRLPYWQENVTFYIGCLVVRTDGRTDGYVITKISRMDR